MDNKTISKRLKACGLTERASQLQMIEQVNTAFNKSAILCLEAPTGTGKTVAYGLGALNAKAKDKKIIISTATIALQEQLIKKDLPLLERILQTELKYSIAKGRRRYVCLARLYKPDWQESLFEQSDQTDKLEIMLEKKQWDGDRDTLDFIIPEDQWNKISTDRGGCTGKNCEFFEDCAFFRARKKMHSAEIIITNHSLLLSDLELGAGAILPEPEKNLYIIDECHHLPEKAMHHFAKSASVMGTIDWINNLNKVSTRAASDGAITQREHDGMTQATKELVFELRELQNYLETQEHLFVENIWHILTIPAELMLHAERLAKLSALLAGLCDHVQQNLEQALELKQKTELKEATENKHLAQFGFLLSRAQNLSATWKLFCRERQENEAPVARWFSHDTHFMCHCSPINVSQDLKRCFWDIVKNGAVLCSATVRALGKFDDFIRKAGLKNYPNLITQSMTSFFDYSRSILFIPKLQHEPSGKNADPHLNECANILPQLFLPNVGTLVLFTSRKAMEYTFMALSDNLASDILMQGAKSKMKLIEAHKNRIRNGKRSILFGLASFGEGLDLPADFCQHVIIHKLPFAVPSTPIELTRSKWLAQNGRNAFMLSTLPQTSIRLTQYAGRLLRQETDSGIVTILDKRLYTKAYGKSLLDNLPPFTRLINVDIGELKKTNQVENLYCE